MLTWTDFRAIVDAKALSIQELNSTDATYSLAAFDGPISYHCTVDEDDNAGLDKTDYETNYQAKANQSIISTNPPFAAKRLPDGKKLFERKHGIAGPTITAGQSATILYTVPYTACKITAVEVVGGQCCDQVDFSILDTAAGTVSTIPNYKLNQFGFGVYISDGRFIEESRYDADLFAGLQLEIVYYNHQATSVTPNFNVTLHEVKS